MASGLSRDTARDRIAGFAAAGARTLDILVDDKQWGAETLDSICGALWRFTEEDDEGYLGMSAVREKEVEAIVKVDDSRYEEDEDEG